MGKKIIVLVIICFLCSPAAAMIKTPNLVAGYRFEGNANDWSGNGNNGTITGATSATGKFGYCLSFNGDAVVTLGTPTSLMAMTYPFTVTVWVNPSTLTQDSVVFSLVPTDTSAALAAGIYNTENKILIGMPSCDFGLSGISTYLTAGTWSHWAIVYTNSSTLTFYLNGVNISLTDVSNWFTPANNNIGARANGAQRLFYGLIDELRIYNTALTASEVRQDMLGYSPGEF